jgi:hypothetical protein
MKSNDVKEIGTITGVFRTKEDAEQAYNALTQRGYSADEITVLMSDKTRERYFKNSADDVDRQDYDADNQHHYRDANDRKHDKDTLGSKAMEKAGVGSAIGGTAGAIIGAIAAIGTSVALPGLGLVVAGPIVAALTGAGAGGLTGGLIGALVGAGIPKERAEVYKKSIEEGGIVVGVVPRSYDDRNLIASDWRNYRGEEIHGVEEENFRNKY